MALLLILSVALAAESDAPSTSPWTVPVLIAAGALMASWFAVIVVILRFASDVGRFTTTVEHLQKSVEGLSSKLDVLPEVRTQLAVHAERLDTVEENVSSLKDHVNRLGSSVTLPEVATTTTGRRATKG